jgi:hypothetical protein
LITLYAAPNVEGSGEPGTQGPVFRNFDVDVLRQENTLEWYRIMGDLLYTLRALPIMAVGESV